MINQSKKEHSKVWEIWDHAKEYVLIVVSSLAGWALYKVKQKDKDQRHHEAKQDQRIENLERRTGNLERNMGIIEERTLHILDDCKEIKEILRDKI